MVANPKKSKAEKLIEKDITKLIIFVGILIVIFIGATAYFRSLNHFEYKGLKFTKEKYGDLPIYHYYYYFKGTDGKLVQYNLYLQNDPRLNNITVTGDRLVFDKPGIYMTVDSSYPSTCNENLAGIYDLTLFLRRNQLEVIPGVMNISDRPIAKEPYITCENRANMTDVIQLRGGSDTHVTITGNCTDIVIGPDCRIQQAIEQYKIQAILDARDTTLLG